MRIAVLRIGTVEESIQKRIQNGLKDIFPQTECLILDKIMQIPTDSFNQARQQFHSTHILAEMDNYVKQAQVDRIIGVTEVDLYVAHLNFVFGEATCPGKTAIISLYRLKPEFYGHLADPELFTERCVKEAVHEIGHTLGLRHCQNPMCVMFFSNSISDTDGKEKVFCEKCYSKVAKCLGR